MLKLNGPNADQLFARNADCADCWPDGRLLATVPIEQTSCKYPSSGRIKLSRFALEFSRPLRASVRSFISIHQVAAATALLLLLLLMRAWFIVIRQVSLAWILYTARTDKWLWPWSWLKHSLGQHESLCQVWSWSAQPFSRPSATYRQTNKHTYRLLVGWGYVDCECIKK